MTIIVNLLSGISYAEVVFIAKVFVLVLLFFIVACALIVIQALPELKIKLKPISKKQRKPKWRYGKDFRDVE